ncbi:MAG: hypothetical protein Q7T87_04075 [Polaromonas sp.]|nr:hypothetical protein [Polaromonas sp.]
MQINLRARSLVLVVLFLAVTGVAIWALWRLNAATGTRVDTSVIAPEVPVVIRTEGGLLEVAVVRAQERFSRADTRSFWGIPLGTTVSHIQAPVFYRYHIQLAPEWRVVLRGKTCIVHAPAIQPSLPVAFDTASLQKFTTSGWARFNKDENLAALERSMTPALEERARSAAYTGLAREPARETVREFVAKWLVKEASWGSGPDYRIEVLFPGETSPRPEAPRQD